MKNLKLTYYFNKKAFFPLCFYRDYRDNFLTAEGIANHYDILETQAGRLIDMGRRIHNKTAEVIKAGGVLKTEELSNKNPLDTQLRRMTGAGYNSGEWKNYFDDNLQAFNGNLIKNLKTGQVIEVI